MELEAFGAVGAIGKGWTVRDLGYREDRPEYEAWWYLMVMKRDADWGRVYGRLTAVVKGRLRAVTCRRVGERTEALMGCSRANMMRHLERQFRGGMTWANYGRVWVIDHVVPICRFDLTRREQVAQACHWTNFQPLFVKENGEKGARVAAQPQLPLAAGVEAFRLPTRKERLGVDISDDEVREKLLVYGFGRRVSSILKYDWVNLQLFVEGVSLLIPYWVVNRLPWLEGKRAFNPDLEKAPTFQDWRFQGSREMGKMACRNLGWVHE